MLHAKYAAVSRIEQLVVADRSFKLLIEEDFGAFLLMWPLPSHTDDFYKPYELTSIL